MRVLLLALILALCISSSLAIQTGRTRVESKAHKGKLRQVLAKQGVLAAEKPSTPATAAPTPADAPADAPAVSSKAKAKTAAATAAPASVKKATTKATTKVATPAATPKPATLAKSTSQTKAGAKAASKASPSVAAAAPSQSLGPAPRANRARGSSTPNPAKIAEKIRARAKSTLPDYALAAKEALAAAADQSWPGQPLITGCTPSECADWCNECGTSTTCENKCFLYSQCNDDC
jgi:cytoskeletal protein RodZ